MKKWNEDLFYLIYWCFLPETKHVLARHTKRGRIFRPHAWVGCKVNSEFYKEFID